MQSKNKRIVVIRIRGPVRLKKQINDTLNMLRLYKKNYCTVIPSTNAYLGMIKKIKDFVTYGEINDETFKLLVEKKGEEYKGREKDSKGKINYNKFFVHENKKIKKFFRLNTPKKGFGRKGIKVHFKVGGALGYRGEKINDLLKRMI